MNTKFWHTAAEYRYYASLYYDRAKFTYEHFPHSGPSFYNAQRNQAKAMYYTKRAEQKEEMEKSDD